MANHNVCSIVYSATLLIILSCSALVTNAIKFHFVGNNYFPPGTLFIGLSLFLMHIGAVVYFNSNARITICLKEVIYFFLIMSVIALATNAAQYTPFNTIDRQILSTEQSLHIDIKSIVSWVNSKPHLKVVLTFIYDTLPYQMSYLPLIFIAIRKTDDVHEYYFLLLISTIIGFTFYYFYPTTAPASIIESSYFSEAQKATGIKFFQIHQQQTPTTMEGGLIALPSFHTIWAWFCLYLLRGFPSIFSVMLPINVLLMASCVLLGWHYLIDILGGLIVIFLSHGIHLFYQLFYYKNRRADVNNAKQILNIIR